MERALSTWPEGSAAAIASTAGVAAALMRGEPVADDAAAAGAALIRFHALAPLAFAAGAEQFRSDYAANVFAADARTDVAREVVGALADESIDVVLIKGISYAGDVYSDPALRPMGDMDILVASGNRERAFRALRERGFVDGTTGGRTDLHHAWQLSRPADRASVDLHRNIVQPWRARIAMDEVWDRSVPATDVPGARRLEPIDQLLFHWAHMARHELWIPLIGYVDSVRLFDRLGDRERGELWTRARRYQLERGCRAALAMTRALQDEVALSGLPVWGRALPRPREVVVGRPPPRPVQLLRKALLNDSWLQVARLGAVFASRRARAWLRRRE